MKTRFLTTKVLLFLFAASWLNVPGMLYERFSFNKFLAYHGHDLFPFFIPVLLVFIVITAEMSRLSKEKTFIKFSVQDLSFLILCILILFLEVLHSGSIGTKFSFNLFLPIFTFYGFYFLYSRYSYLVRSTDPTRRLLHYSVYLLVFLLCIHLLGYLGFVPHFRAYGGSSSLAIELLANLTRVDVLQANTSSYYAVFLIFIILFFRKLLNFRAFTLTLFFSLALLMLFWNQSRGAMVTLVLVLFIKLMETERITTFYKTLILLFSFTLLTSLAVIFANSRLFNFADSSGLERVTLIYSAVTQIMEYPLLGLGADFEQNFRFGFASKVVVHSWILRFMIGYGIVGFVFILFTYLKMFNQRINFGLLASLGLVLGVMIFETYLFWWMSLLPVFSYYAFRIKQLNQPIKAT